MNPSKNSSLETEVSELKAQVNNQLDKLEKQNALIRKLTTENSALRGEIRHLKKLKGQPKIRPNKKDPEDGKVSKDSKPTSASGNTSPPKSKRPRSQESGRTAKPSPSSVREKICPAEGVQDSWKSKGYQDFTHIDVNLEFTTTRYRREVWLTPEGKTVIAPLPAHVKGRFGDSLTAMVLDLYHSCSVIAA